MANQSSIVCYFYTSHPSCLDRALHNDASIYGVDCLVSKERNMRRCTSKQIVSWCCLHCFAQIQLLVSRQLWSTITRRGCSRRRHAFAQSKPSPIAGVTEWPQTRTDGDVNPTCGGGRDGAALLARDKPGVSVSRRSPLLPEEEPKQDDDTPGWSYSSRHHHWHDNHRTNTWCRCADTDTSTCSQLSSQHWCLAPELPV